jgi:hypothetical protein
MRPGMNRSNRSRALFAMVLLAPALAACASGERRPGAAKAAPVAAPMRPSRLPAGRAPQRQNPPPARVLTAPGLEGVIGAPRAELLRQFGPARLDVWEGDARKLQFSGTACVLDIFLYPSAPGREPQATYVDARRSSDGKDVDRAGCIAALRRR